MEIQRLKFTPLKGLTSGYWQTIVASFGVSASDPPSTSLIVPVSHGDLLCCEVSTPLNWDNTKVSVVLVHGMGGDHRSLYMIRLSRRLYNLGVRVVRVNLRGAGTGEGLACYPGGGGCSEDIFAVLQELKKEDPDGKPVKLIGFSLGGNIILKLLGELGCEGPKWVEEAVAVCPAIDLESGARTISLPQNKLFERYYVKALLKIVSKKQQYFPELKQYIFPKKMSIYQFDTIYTAPLCGFKSADEYYEECSAKNFVATIQVPTKILFSSDDPIVLDHTIRSAHYSNAVELYETLHGGHLAFLGPVGRGYGIRWMDKQLMEWLVGYEE